MKKVRYIYLSLFIIFTLLLSSVSPFCVFAADTAFKIKLTGNAGTYGADLSWDITGADASDIAGYNLYRGTSPDNISTAPITDFYITDTEYLDQYALNGGKYYYVCRAIYQDGTLSRQSNIIGIDMESGKTIEQALAPTLSLTGVQNNQVIIIGEKITLSATSSNLKYIQYYWKDMDNTSEWGQVGKQFIDRNDTTVVWDTAGRKPGKYIVKVQGLNTPNTTPVLEVVRNVTLKEVTNQIPSPASKTAAVKITLPDQPSNSNNVSGKVKVGAVVSDPAIKAVDYYIDSVYVTTGFREKGFFEYIDTNKFSNGVHGITANGRYLKDNSIKDLIYGTSIKVNFQNTAAKSSISMPVTGEKEQKVLQNTTQYEIVPGKKDYFYPKVKFLFIKLHESVFIGVKEKNNEKVFSKKLNSELVWELGTKGIVKIDDYGTLTGVGDGLCDLYLKSKEGKIYDYVRVSVYDERSGYTLLATRMPPKLPDGTSYAYKDSMHGIQMMTLDKFNCIKEGSDAYRVTMDIYNRYTMTPVLHTTDNSWAIKQTLFIKPYKLPSSISDIGGQYLATYNEITSGKYFTNYYDKRSEVTYEKTSVNVKVPVGGLIQITLSSIQSNDVFIYNALTILFDVWQNTQDYKELVKKDKFFKEHLNLKQLVNRAKLVNIIKAKLKTETLSKFKEELVNEITDENPYAYPYVVYTKLMNFFNSQDISITELAADLIDINAVGNASVATVKDILEDSVLTKVPDGKVAKSAFAVLDSINIEAEVSELLYNRDEYSLYIFIPNN